MLAAKNPYIDSAYQQLQIISQDKQKRLEYEAREKAVRDHNQMMFEAEQRGKEQGEYNKSIQIAKNMLKKEIYINTIIEITGLNITDIEALR